MAFNLLRNSRVFFTTNVDGTGAVLATGHLATNSFELQVMDGFSYSQNTTSETVTLNEGGTAPVRGQRSFNTALDPVEFSFDTYIRPQDGGVNITAEESVLWNALFAKDPIGGSEPAWVEAPTVGTASATYSNKHQLQTFGIIVLLENSTYIIDNCALDTATIDFGLDSIAMIKWTGKGTKLRSLSPIATAAAGTYGGGLTGSYKQKVTTAPFIANKLSTVVLTAEIGGTGTAYTVPITGGSLSINNNITYLTPANLGVVNQPVTYFTGTRAISGSLTAYLRTGTNETADLLEDLLASSTTDVNPAFLLEISVGGKSNATRVELDMNAAVLTIPSISTEQVVSTTINFTAQGYNGAAFDISAVNELEVRYYTTNA